jgi:hypothetical protein
MWRKQIAVVFWALLVWSMLVAAVRADVDGLSNDLSLIGYDDRGVQQSKDDEQPCQSCPPAVTCQLCPPAATCQCNASTEPHLSAAAPMILNIGPPPRLYSPSSDFGARAGAEVAAWSIVGDESPTSPSSLHRIANGSSVPCVIVPAPQPVYSTPGAAANTWHQAPSCSLDDGATPLMPEFTATYSPSMAMVTAPKCIPTIMYPNFAAAALSPAASFLPTTGEGVRPMVGEAERMDHMLQAIYHLEAAGLQAEADRLRGECDAQMHDVVNRLKSAEAELARLQKTVGTETATASANHPQKPVVTVALRAGKGEERKYPVQQAGYISPSETLDRPDESFDQRPLPAPFVPQPITIEPMNIFGTPGESWDVKPIPDLNSPFMFDGHVFTPDTH